MARALSRALEPSPIGPLGPYGALGPYRALPWARGHVSPGSTTLVLKSAEGEPSAIVTFESPLDDATVQRIHASAPDTLAAADIPAALAAYGTVAQHVEIAPPRIDSDGVRGALLEKLSTLEGRATSAHAAATEISNSIEAQVAELNAQQDAAYGAREAALLAELEALQTEAVVYTARREAESRAQTQAIELEAQLALSQAVAARDGLIGAAVDTPGGRYYAAIEAARRFDAGRLARTPEQLAALRQVGTLQYWRRYFLGESLPR